LNIFLETYGDFFDQYVNNSNNSFFTMYNSTTFVSKIQRIFFCSHGCLFFTYLGVSIFDGAPKFQFLQPLVDKVKLKLASWKGKSISMMSQIQLVNTMITGILLIALIRINDLFYFLSKLSSVVKILFGLVIF